MKNRMFGYSICNNVRFVFLIGLQIIFIRLSSAQEKGEFISGNFHSSNKDSMVYQFYHPSGMDTTKNYPLIIFLHGKGERGTDNEKQLHWIKNWMPDSVERENHKAFILAPQCSKERMWSNYDKLAESISFDTITPEIQKTLMELIQTVSNDYSIDTNRIYIIGLSMGGFGVFDLITRYPDKFAAAVSICGGADPNQAEIIKKTPVWAFHGKKDEIVSLRHTEKIMTIIEDENHQATYFEKMNHNIWTKVFSEFSILNWMKN